MRSFEFTRLHVGWVTAEIRSESDAQTFTASYLSDAIRDFADALASLVTAPTATCRWEQEPGQVVWHFTRSDSVLTVTVSGLFHNDRQMHFKHSFQYLSFCRDVLDSLNGLKDALGLGGFEKEWGYPFPAEAGRKLQDAIASNCMVGSGKRIIIRHSERITANPEVSEFLRTKLRNNCRSFVPCTPVPAPLDDSVVSGRMTVYPEVVF